MPLDIQTGHFADKLRRALGVRGRMPLRLDESVVPMVQVQQLDLPPWRNDALEFSGGIDQGPTIAEYSFGGVKLPADVPGAIVVDGITIQNSGAAVSYSLHMGTAADYDVTDAGAPIQQARNVEQQPRGDAGTFPRLLPFKQFSRGTDGVLGLGSPALWYGRLNADTTLVLPWRYTIRPGWVLALWHRTVNLQLIVSWHGTYYPDAPGVTT